MEHRTEKKQNRILWLRSLLFLVILMGWIVLLGHLFLPKNNREDYGMGEMKANGILAEEPDTVDVLAIGDSECALSFSPMVLWREQGISSYNCGTTGQYLYESVSYLKQAFKTQQPKVVLLEANTIYRNCDKEDWLLEEAQERIPALRYHDRWKNLRKEDLGKVENTWIDEYKGQMVYQDQEPYEGNPDYMMDTEDVRQITRINELCIREIQKICQEQGARLVLYSAPSPVNWTMEQHNGVQALADKMGVNYLDFNLGDQVRIDWQTETKDGGDHVNRKGAEKVSVYLASYLKQQYDLTDHRGDKAYDSWKEGLATYEEEENDPIH
jgi:hypothetical protein